MNLRRIIKEEVDDFDWIRANNPYKINSLDELSVGDTLMVNFKEGEAPVNNFTNINEYGNDSWWFSVEKIEKYDFIGALIDKPEHYGWPCNNFDTTKMGQRCWHISPYNSEVFK